MKEDVKIPQTDADVREIVYKRYTKALDAKKLAVQRIRLNLAYYLGRQYAYINPSSNAFMAPMESQIVELVKKGMILLTVNKIYPAVNFVCSQLTQRQPRLNVLPKILSEEASTLAKAYDDVLAYVRFRKEYIINDQHNAKWCTITGKAYKMTYPDFNDIKTITVDGMPVPQSYPEIKETVLSPLEVFGPPGIKKLNDWPWLIISRMINRELVESTWSVDLGTYEGMAANSMPIVTTDVQTGDIYEEDARDMIQVMEYFERPNAKNPMGAHFVVCQDKVLKATPWPYYNFDGSIDKSYRITEYTFSDSLVSHISDGLPAQVMDLQRKFNMLWSLYMTITTLCSTPKMMVTPGVKSQIFKFLANYPDTIEVDPSEPGAAENIRWLEGPGGGEALLAAIHEVEQAIEEITGVHATSQGQEPDRRMPAEELQMLQQADVGKFQSVYELREESESQHGYNILKNYQQYAPWATYRILGKERMGDVQEIKIHDLDNFDVIVESGSSIPDSKAGQYQSLREMLQYGLFNGPNGMIDPNQAPKIIRSMDLGWNKELIAEDTASMNLAREENRIMKSGNPCVVLPEYNHQVHLQIHKGYIDSPEQLKRGPTETNLIRKHIELHESGVNEAVQKQAALMQQINPQQPPPGAGQPAPK